jgi:hypothetical protein
MPTVFRLGGLRVVIYPADHRPAHVHIVGQGGEAVFLLNCPSGPAELREVYGFGRSEVTRLRDSVAAMTASLCEQWRNIHGDY